MFVALCSSPHPASATIRGVVQFLCGVGEQGVVAWVDAEEFSLGEETTAGFDDLWHSMMFI